MDKGKHLEDMIREQWERLVVDEGHLRDVLDTFEEPFVRLDGLINGILSRLEKIRSEPDSDVEIPPDEGDLFFGTPLADQHGDHDDSLLAEEINTIQSEFESLQIEVIQLQERITERFFSFDGVQRVGLNFLRIGRSILENISPMVRTLHSFCQMFITVTEMSATAQRICGNVAAVIEAPSRESWNQVYNDAQELWNQYQTARRLFSALRNGMAE